MRSQNTKAVLFVAVLFLIVFVTGCKKTDSPLNPSPDQERERIPYTEMPPSEESLTEKDIEMFLAERDNVEISSVAILHKQEEGMYMRGEYTVDGEEKTFLAIQESGKWNLIASDILGVDCGIAITYNFPIGLVPECEQEIMPPPLMPEEDELLGMPADVVPDPNIPMPYDAEDNEQKDVVMEKTVFCDALTPCQVGMCVVLPGTEMPTCVADEAAACASCAPETDCAFQESYPPRVQCFNSQGEEDQVVESGNISGEYPPSNGTSKYCDAVTPCEAGICVVLPGEEIPTCVADEKAACASCDSETDCISDRKYPPKIQCFSRDGGDIFQTEENGNSGAQEDGSLGE